MNLSRLLFLMVLLLMADLAFAQQVPQKAMAHYFQAKEYAQSTQWEEGIAELDKAIKIYPDYTEAKTLMADYFMALKKYDTAVAILEACYRKEGFQPRYIFFLAEACLRINQTDKAAYYAQQYLSQPLLNPGAMRKSEQIIRNAQFAAEAKKNPVPFQPKNLGAAINTEHWEYFPYMTPDGKLLAFTRLQNNQEDIYVSTKTEKGFSPAVSLGNIINTADNEGAETMNADGTLLFFTACNRMDGYGSCDIYFSQKLKGNWTAAMGIGKPINTSAWEAQPSFSSDGRALYFSSSRPGGLGGKDIWVSYLDEQLKWSEPQNLGPNINTANDDQCPFIHADNQTLYFTSAGWPGMGGGDIYISRKTDTGWTKAENLGYPINTETDDNGLAVSYDGKMAFLASNRENGFGGLDIYSFELPEKMQPKRITYLKATVRDAVTKQLLQANYSMTDLETKKESKGVTQNGSFFATLEVNKNNALQIQQEGYLFYSRNINLTAEASATQPFEMEVLLQPISANGKITLNNVFFDFDKSELKPESFAELDKLVELLLKNPAVKMEIAGHTDSKGDKKYNLLLSQKRAESVMEYLLKKGIDKLRLTAKGYGDTQPVAPNDTEENQAKNRRTEVKVL
ncbi:MAG TPA: OmpA family protein [Chitinophagales bacterium]|mgnify:FL=1|nr:OmpA family protein [Chitinophagales bacterium]